MAFTTPITCQYTRQHLSAGYCKAEVTLSNAAITRVELTVWESAQAREDYPDSPAFSQRVVHVLDTDLELQSENPLDYAYQLLQASGLYPGAQWGV